MKDWEIFKITITWTLLCSIVFCFVAKLIVGVGIKERIEFLEDRVQTVYDMAVDNKNSLTEQAEQIERARTQVDQLYYGKKSNR